MRQMLFNPAFCHFSLAGIIVYTMLAIIFGVTINMSAVYHINNIVDMIEMLVSKRHRQ